MHRRAGAAFEENALHIKKLLYIMFFSIYIDHGTAIERDGSPRDD
jgi:hypothetical protein